MKNSLKNARNSIAVIAFAFVSTSGGAIALPSADYVARQVSQSNSCGESIYELASHNCRCAEQDQNGNCVRWSGCGSHSAGGVRG